MATRSFIGKEADDGSIVGIYCHWDGYPESVGKRLLNHYTDPGKIDAMLALGDLSSLGKEIGEKHDFDKRPEGQCTAYGRDRGETGVEARLYADEAAYLKASEDYGTDWTYLHRAGEWHCLYEGLSLFGQRVATPKEKQSWQPLSVVLEARAKAEAAEEAQVG